MSYRRLKFVALMKKDFSQDKNIIYTTSGGG